MIFAKRSTQAAASLSGVLAETMEISCLAMSLAGSHFRHPVNQLKTQLDEPILEHRQELLAAGRAQLVKELLQLLLPSSSG